MKNVDEWEVEMRHVNFVLLVALLVAVGYLVRAEFLALMVQLWV